MKTSPRARTGALTRHVELSQATALVLAGGAGTRLRAAVSDRPKVLAPVSGRPFVAFLLDQVAAAGLRSAVVSTGYMGEMVQHEFGEVCGNLRLSYSHEDKPLGTGGAIRLALDKISSRWVIVFNGDSYSDVDLGAMWVWHHERRADCTMALVRVADRNRYGSVRTDMGDRIIAFEEKGSSVGGGWINAGIYVIARELIEDLPAQRDVSLEREVFPTWLRQRFFGFRGSGRFLDIGTPESYAAAEKFFAGRNHR